MKEIPLTNSLKVAEVDDEDFEYLSLFNWSSYSNGTRTYANACINHCTISMHREIMNPPKGKVVHHRNGKGLDNRRANLQIVLIHYHQAIHALNKSLNVGVT